MHVPPNIKVFIVLVCIITTCVDMFIEIVVIPCDTVPLGCTANVTTRDTGLVYIWQSNYIYDPTNYFKSLLQQRIQQPMLAFLTLVILLFLLMYECPDNFLFLFLLKYI